MLQGIRAFFMQREVLEVETPVLASTGVTEHHIESFTTRVRSQEYYLQTSPEYAMKRLLASGYPAIYQISKVFRLEEQGPLHNPEFSMLEWYRPGYDYLQLIDEVIELLQWLGNDLGGEIQVDRKTYQQAFIESVNIDPLHTTVAQLSDYCQQQQVDIPQGMSNDNVDEWLDWVLTQAVAPTFNRQGFTVLYNYPASQCALATVNREKNIAERFEVYFGELELANGFNELTDAGEQLERFKNDNAKRKAVGLKTVPIDRQFIAALESGLPACAGVAIGLDRLLMVLTGQQRIDQVLAFPFDHS